MGLFYVKFDYDLNTTVEKNSPGFLMVTYMHSNDQWFRRYGFWTTMELLKTEIWTDCSFDRKIKSGTVWMGFFPGAE